MTSESTVVIMRQGQGLDAALVKTASLQADSSLRVEAISAGTEQPTAVSPLKREPESHEEQPDIGAAAHKDLAGQACKLEALMSTCSSHLAKLAVTITPWGINKRTKKIAAASEELNKARADIGKLMPQIVHRAESNAATAYDTQKKLTERESLLALTRDQEATITRSNQTVADLSSKMRALLIKIDGGRAAQREARGAAGGRFDIGTKEDTVQKLFDAVEALMQETRELKQGSAVTDKAKADLSKRVREMQDKLRDECEIRDRELQSLRAALKKASDNKETSLGVNKEQVSKEVTKQASEIKALQHRLEGAKNEADHAKGLSKACKAATEQAQAALAVSQEEARQLNKKLQDAKLQREDTARELEHAKAEQAMVFSELSQLRSGASPAKKSQYYDSASAWPRIAFSTRGGGVLHKAACGNVDTNKCSPFQYENHKELEEHLREDNLVLCHTCRTESGF